MKLFYIELACYNCFQSRSLSFGLASNCKNQDEYTCPFIGGCIIYAFVGFFSIVKSLDEIN
ncbi:unnamed protein product [Coffea canephora]|uniref:Uncharacterized protein n=1 Tax=Coffea canephora TaxID=49390 RepID=A0A068TKF7_COFCA|nr:unnamed protein product [Coffea canephora]